MITDQTLDPFPSMAGGLGGSEGPGDVHAAAAQGHAGLLGGAGACPRHGGGPPLVGDARGGGIGPPLLPAASGWISGPGLAMANTMGRLAMLQTSFTVSTPGTERPMKTSAPCTASDSFPRRFRGFVAPATQRFMKSIPTPRPR